MKLFHIRNTLSVDIWSMLLYYWIILRLRPGFKWKMDKTSKICPRPEFSKLLRPRLWKTQDFSIVSLTNRRYTCDIKKRNNHINRCVQYQLCSAWPLLNNMRWVFTFLEILTFLHLKEEELSEEYLFWSRHQRKGILPLQVGFEKV